MGYVTQLPATPEVRLYFFFVLKRSFIRSAKTLATLNPLMALVSICL